MRDPMPPPIAIKTGSQAETPRGCQIQHHPFAGPDTLAYTKSPSSPGFFQATEPTFAPAGTLLGSCCNPPPSIPEVTAAGDAGRVPSPEAFQAGDGASHVWKVGHVSVAAGVADLPVLEVPDPPFEAGAQP